MITTKEVILVSGKKRIVRVVALQVDSAKCETIVNIYESHEFEGDFFYADGRTLKPAIAHRIVDGLRDLESGAANKLAVYMKEEDQS